MPTPSSYRIILVMLCLSLFSGCATYRYIPAENSASGDASDTLAPVVLKVNSPELKKGKPFFNGAEKSKIQKAVKETAAETLEDLSSSATLPSTPTLNFSVENSASKTHWGSFFLYVITLSLVPNRDDMHFDSQMTVQSGDKTLFESESRGSMRRYLSVYFPTPLFVGKSSPAPATRMMVKAMLAQHRDALSQWVASEKQQYDQQVVGKSMVEQRQWLIEHPDSLFANDILAKLASHPPQRNPLAWHQENAKRFPGYLSLLSDKDALWFVGPEGQRVIDLVNAVKHGTSQSILAAKVEVRGPYKNFNNEEIQRLQQAGLSGDLIAAMIRSTTRNASPAPKTTAAPAVVAQSTGTANNTVAALLIHDNSGQYMNPWTSDGVLAEWVDKAINAKMGSAVGSAVGAYAASKAMDNVPFVGGFLGSKVGKNVGRSAAISAVGGMDYIRRTSDQSFRSLPDMARYLKASYGAESNFQDAVKAADAIYPGLLRALASAK